MNVVDLLAAASVAGGALRGRKRGLADEAYRLLRVGISFAAGCGLYGFVSDLLGKVLSLGGDVSGPMGFIATMGGTWSVLRLLRQKLQSLVDAHLARHAAVGGAVAGGIRAFVWVLAILSAFHLAGSAPGREQLSEKSLAGQIAGWVVK